MQDGALGTRTRREVFSSGRNSAVFSIVSANYAHYAITLFESLSRTNSSADRFVILVDTHGEEHFPDDVTVIPISDLDLPRGVNFCHRYDILELNTAVKPFAFRSLFGLGYDLVTYFDPDICLYRNLDVIESQLDDSEILLTPHITAPVLDNYQPQEVDILRAGTFNLGFLGLKRGDESRKMLDWWSDKLSQLCINDIPNGYFVDQKWMDLVPSLFNQVKVVKDAGWNVAYWNLHYRHLDFCEAKPTVNGSELVFFHFSGFNLKDKLVSKHQSRFNKSDFSQAFQDFFNGYGDRLEVNGLNKFKDLPFGFGFLPDGTPLPPYSASFVRSEQSFLGLDFTSAFDVSAIKEVFNRRASLNSRIFVSRYLLHVWRIREDLRAEFPAVLRQESDQQRLVEWYLSVGSKQLSLAECFLEPMRQAEARATDVGSTKWSTWRSVLASLFWRVKDAFPISFRRRFGDRIYQFVNENHPTLKTPQGLTEAAPRVRATFDFDAVNVMAYFDAQSGIGQAGRAMSQVLESLFDRVHRVPIQFGHVGGRLTFPKPFSEPCADSVSVICANADQVPLLAERSEWSVIGSTYKIGVWYWELEDFPDDLVHSAKLLDEIWVGSNFVRRAIARKGISIPISVVPPAVNLAESACGGRERFGWSDGDFVIFSSCDCLSVVNRKNPQGIYGAFTKLQTETGAMDLRLCMKLANTRGAGIDEFVSILESDPSVTLIQEDLEPAEYSALIRSIDVAVSLHRSEGFGLVPAEAMSLGKCVVATGYGGNTDYMDSSNSQLVDYTLRPVGSGSPPYHPDAMWAEPDLDDAVKKLQALYASPELRKKLGENARASMRERFSVEAIEVLIRERLLQ